MKRLFLHVGIVFAVVSALLWSGVREAHAQFAPPKFVKIAAETPKMVAPGKPFALAIKVTIDSPYHIQANPPKQDYVATILHIGAVRGVQVGKISYPKGELIQFAGDKLPVYEGTVTIRAQVTVDRPGIYTLPITVNYQGCNQTSCYPPTSAATRMKLTVGAAQRGHR